MFDCTHYFFLLVLLVLLNNNLRVKSCYSVTSVIYTHFFSSVSDWWNQFPLTAQQSFRALVALVAQSSFLSWKRSQLTTASIVMTCQSWHVIWCWHLLATASLKKKVLPEKVPLCYNRWNLTANEGQRKKERTFAVQQMEADCKARSLKEDKYRASPFISLYADAF